MYLYFTLYFLYTWVLQVAKESAQRTAVVKAWIARLLDLLLAAAETATQPLSKPQETYISARTPGTIPPWLHGTPCARRRSSGLHGFGCLPQGVACQMCCWLPVAQDKWMSVHASMGSLVLHIHAARVLRGSADHPVSTAKLENDRMGWCRVHSQRHGCRRHGHGLWLGGFGRGGRRGQRQRAAAGAEGSGVPM